MEIPFISFLIFFYEENAWNIKTSLSVQGKAGDLLHRQSISAWMEGSVGVA